MDKYYKIKGLILGSLLSKDEKIDLLKYLFTLAVLSTNYDDLVNEGKKWTI